MKKCPSCQKTFDDNLKFCQSDGTPLVAVADQAESDPYQTIVGNQADISGIIAEQDKIEEPKIEEKEADPFQTMVAPPPPKSTPSVPPQISEDKEDILEVSNQDDKGEDMMKTMIITGDTATNIKVDIPDEKPLDNTPPISASGELSFDKKQDREFEAPKFNQPETEIPKSDGFSPKPENFASADKPKFSEPPSDLKSEDENTGSRGISDNKSSSIPIPSPFDKSMPPGYAPPLTPPFEPSNEPFKPEPLNEPKAETPKSSFAEAESDSLSGDSAWSPPSAPVAEWENKEIGQNTPFDTPPTIEGQNMTLAYISLATGILSMTICCLGGILVGPIGIITGFLARKKAAENPAEYGGEKFALIGMITGGVGILFWIILLVVQVFFGFLGSIM